MSKTTARVLVAITAASLGLAWYIKKGKEDMHPKYDSFGQEIDYNHSISYIKPSTDPKVVQQAYASWRLEERIRREKLGDQYIVKPFDVTDYYGGYRDTASPNAVVLTPPVDPGPNYQNPVPVFHMDKNFIL